MLENSLDAGATQIMWVCGCCRARRASVPSPARLHCLWQTPPACLPARPSFPCPRLAARAAGQPFTCPPPTVPAPPRPAPPHPQRHRQGRRKGAAADTGQRARHTGARRWPGAGASAGVGRGGALVQLQCGAGAGVLCGGVLAWCCCWCGVWCGAAWCGGACVPVLPPGRTACLYRRRMTCPSCASATPPASCGSLRICWAYRPWGSGAQGGSVAPQEGRRGRPRRQGDAGQLSASPLPRAAGAAALHALRTSCSLLQSSPAPPWLPQKPARRQPLLRRLLRRLRRLPPSYHRRLRMRRPCCAAAAATSAAADADAAVAADAAAAALMLMLLPFCPHAAPACPPQGRGSGQHLVCGPPVRHHNDGGRGARLARLLHRRWVGVAAGGGGGGVVCEEVVVVCVCGAGWWWVTGRKAAHTDGGC